MPKSKLIAGLSINIILLGIVSFLTDMSTEMLVPLLPFFLAGLGATSLLIGIIEGIAESTGSFLKLVSGIYADKLRKKKIFVLSGYSLSNLTKPLLAFATSTFHVLGVRVVDRIGKGIRTTPRDGIIADSSKASERGKAYGVHRALDTSGAVVGPLIALIVLLVFGTAMDVYRLVFLLSALPGIAAIIVILFVRETRGIQSRKFSLSLEKFPPNFRLFVVAIGIFGVGNFSVAFLLLRSHQVLEMPVYVEVGFYVLMNVSYAALAYPMGVLSDRVGRKTMLVMGFGVFAAVMFLFTFVNSFLLLMGLFLCFGLYMAMTDGTMRAITSVMVCEEVRCSALGIVNLVTSITIFPANFLAGFLWDMFGSWAAFAFSGILALASGLLLVFSVDEVSSVPS
ncbi:MAG: MFS transporter [Thermoplasmata archaeon]|nr:MFS transporter [Thermoplasmata archaeon]